MYFLNFNNTVLQVNNTIILVVLDDLTMIIAQKN